MFVQEVSGGPEGDDEPAHHHSDGSRQVHCLVEQNKLDFLFPVPGGEEGKSRTMKYIVI